MLYSKVAHKIHSLHLLSWYRRWSWYSVGELCNRNKHPFLIGLASADLGEVLAERGFDGLVSDLWEPVKMSAPALMLEMVGYNRTWPSVP